MYLSPVLQPSCDTEYCRAAPGRLQEHTQRAQAHTDVNVCAAPQRGDSVCGVSWR